MPTRVDLEIGDGGVNRAFDNVSRNIGKVADEMRELRKDLRDTAQEAQKSARDIKSAERTAKGPAARMQQAMADLEKAKASGDPARIFDAEYLAKKAIRAEHYARTGQRLRDGKPPTQQEMTDKADRDLLYTSRTFVDAITGELRHTPIFGRLMNPHVSAAMKQFMGANMAVNGGGMLARIGLAGGGAAGGSAAGSAVAAGAAGGPLGVLIVAGLAAAVGGLVALGQETLKTASALRELAASVVVSGGYTGALWAARGLGLDGARARAFQGSIQSGAGAAMAARLGINPIGAPYGDINYTRKLLVAIEALRRETNDARARRMAEILGIGDLYWMRGISNVSFNALKMSTMIPTKQAGKNAAELEAARMRVGNAFGGVGEAFGRAASPALIIGFNALASSVERASLGLKLFAYGVEAIMSGIGRLMDRLPWLRGGADGEKSNRDALNENTRALKEFRDTIGGGRRARGAMPDGFRPNNMGAERMEEYRRSVRMGLI